MGTAIWNWLISAATMINSLFGFSQEILFKTVYYGRFYEGTWHSVPINLISVFAIFGVGFWLTIFIIKTVNIFS